jgi:arylsulfatase A-like enzyme
MLGTCSDKPGQQDRPPLPLIDGLKKIETCPDQTQLTRRYTERAISFLKKNQSKPFFLYLAHTMPHVPLHVSDRFKGTSELGLFGDVIQELDWSVGEIFRTLRELKLDDNTLVVFTSDNGPWLAQNENGGHADPLRDGKFSRYEGGFRVPCLMRWPGHIPANRVCSEVSSTIDMLPTFARLSGGVVPADRIIDGRDIWPLLSGARGATTPHTSFFYHTEAVRNGKWKLYRPGTYDEGTRDAQGRYHSGKVTYDHMRLYDLDADISEQRDIAADHPDVVERLNKLLAAHAADLKTNSRPAANISLRAQ